MSYSQSSPYYNTEIQNDDYLDVMINRSIPYNPLDVFWEITVVYQYRPDLLAYDLYGDAGLWWVFAQRNPNNLKDPMFDFVAGKKIFIPQLTTLKEVLGL